MAIGTPIPSFTYFTPAMLAFGTGALNQLDRLIEPYEPHSILLVASGNYIDDLGITAAVKAAAQRVNPSATLIETRDVVPNPRIDLVRTLIEQARHEHVDLIIAAGGASSFDTAKAVGAGLCYDGDVWDLFTGKAQVHDTVPVGVISTIAGSGSEVSDCAVLQNGHDKRALETRTIIPRFAIVDPAFSATAPYHYQAAAAADLAVGFLEPYFTAGEHIESADRLLEGGFVAALRAGEKYADDPSDEKNRAELHWLSATMFNHCFLATGSENDWTTHRIEHEIGGQFDVIHGEGIAAILPSIIRVIARRAPQRYAQLAVRALHVDPYDHTPLEAANTLADALEHHFTLLGLATSLHELNIPREAIGTIAGNLTHDGTSTVGNYSPLNLDDVVEILNTAW